MKTGIVFGILTKISTENVSNFNNISSKSSSVESPKFEFSFMLCIFPWEANKGDFVWTFEGWIYWLENKIEFYGDESPF